MGDLDDQLRRLAEQRAARTPVTSPADVFGAAPRRPSRFPVLVAAAAIFAALAGLAIWLADDNAEDGTNVAGTTSTTTTTTTTTTAAPDPDPTTPPEPANSGPTVIVSADDYGVLLSVPETWVEIEQGRTWGDDNGFAAVEVAAGSTLAEAADASIAADSGSFLGSAPTITETTVAGRSALLISGNEPATESDFGDFVMGAVVIEAPAPITVHDESWAYLTVAGDLANLPTILESLEWVAPPREPTRTEIVFPDPTVSYDLVVGTAAGIELRQTFTKDVDVISGPPTGLAFFIDGWLISQDEERGPVRAGTGSFPDALDLGDGTLRLQDAAIVDGRATVLVTRRTGTTVEDTKERLLMVDLEDRSVTDLGVVGGWESGVDDGRFADGAIALLKSAEGSTWIAALDYDGNGLWTTPETFEGTLSITVFSDTVSALNPSWAADGEAPFFAVRRFELRSGDLIDNVSRRLTPVDGVALDEVYCQRLVSWPSLSCGQAVGTPVEINFYSQTIAALPGALSGGTPTTVDAVVSTEFPPLPTCDGDSFSVPGDTLLAETVLLPTGGVVTVLVFEQDGDIYVQAVDDGRPTKPIALGLPADRAGELRIGTESQPEEGDFSVSLSGEGVYVTFDGCELSVGARWIA